MTRLPGLGGGAEFDRIRGIALALGDQAGPLDDDCALVPADGGWIVLSTDATVEGVHFRRDWLSPFEIGWRAAAAALSDLAAEGASVVGVLAAVCAPRSLAEADLVEVMRGVGTCSAKAGGLVLGGDLSSAPSISLTITAVGRAARPVTRTGARPGDGLWITGTLGASRAALVALMAGKEPAAAARAAFATPEPRIAAGQALALLGATAMLDLSDGLAGDAGHLSAASGVRLRIDLGQLPVASSVEAARGVEDAAAFAARGGEDYELLVALPPDVAPQSGLAATGVRLTRVGVIEAGSGVRFHLEGRDISLSGFDHFA